MRLLDNDSYMSFDDGDEMKLKTLKDLQYAFANDPNYKYGNWTDVNSDQLRAEAIKWIKTFDCCDDAEEIFKEFFNITEEDLK